MNDDDEMKAPSTIVHIVAVVDSIEIISTLQAIEERKIKERTQKTVTLKWWEKREGQGKLAGCSGCT